MTDAPTGRRVRLGMLTPSSNTVLEPVVAAMLSQVPDVTAHFSRFRVTRIALGDDALAQFDDAPMVAAAELLADARVDVIVWNGTSAGWLGFGADRRLCARIEATTGIPATTAVLTLNDVLAERHLTRLGLVTPYTDDVQERIIASYAGLGVVTTAERHLGLSENHAFGLVGDDSIRAMVRDVARTGVDVVVPFCTNLAAGPLAAELERELDVPVYDTVALAVRGGLRRAGVDPAVVRGWGTLFAR